MNVNIKTCKDLLLQHKINPASVIEYEVNGELHSLTLEWIIKAYMQGSQESKEIFYHALKSVLPKGKVAVEPYFQQMGQLILMTSLSENEVQAG